MKIIIKKYMKSIKESMSGVSTWALALALFVCLLLAVYLGDEAVLVSSRYGDKELPIYSVETDEKKIAISFDAAWGAEDHFCRLSRLLFKRLLYNHVLLDSNAVVR